MDIKLKTSKINNNTKLAISGSKSETNRLLMLQALYPNLSLQNASTSDDSNVMQKALQSDEAVIDIHHAGTAMRFLTAYFAIQEGKTVTLTGSERMQQRPIQILVDALRQLGVEIQYEKNEGFPPLKITGTKIGHSEVTLKADVSSQYISALLLIAPKLANGLQLTLEGNITSESYIKMTLALLNEIGVKTTFERNVISVFPTASVADCSFAIESDWSSASYFYSIIALSEIGTEIILSIFKQNSFQGDRELANIYEGFGVETTYRDGAIVIRKNANQLPSIATNLQNTPDIAQTIAVTAFALGIECHLTGLHTLKIKETDRLEALRSELMKLGADVSVTLDSLTLKPSIHINPNVTIKTYDDHRMAMAFAPLALKVPITIENAEVVSKSYPNFWQDLMQIGFKSAAN